MILSDTFGRPLRMGQTDCAIGVAGLLPLTSYAGRHDVFGRTLRVTEIATADEIAAAAAELVMQKAAQCPAAIVRGCDPSHVMRAEAGRDGYDAERGGGRTAAEAELRRSLFMTSACRALSYTLSSPLQPAL